MRSSFGFKGYLSDFEGVKPTNFWTGIGGQPDPVYVVQTNERVIERCLLMATDPGNLVLDPTCGSGTTGYVAEQWGRRWITIDTSRVALAIARQRILTAKFERYRVKGEDTKGNGGGGYRPEVDPHPGFIHKTVPHITLKSIAQNQNLDPIFAKHEPILDERLKACNAALGRVSEALRANLAGKLVTKAREDGKKSITDADVRRWELPRGTVRGTAFQAAQNRGVGSQPMSHGQDAHATSQGRDAPATFDPRFLEIREGAYLPHWRQEGAAYSVTFRLGGSLPEEVLAAWVRERDEIVRRAAAAKRPLSEQESAPPE